MRCQECDSEVPNNAKFCPSCGHELSFGDFDRFLLREYNCDHFEQFLLKEYSSDQDDVNRLIYALQKGQIGGIPIFEIVASNTLLEFCKQDTSELSLHVQWYLQYLQSQCESPISNDTQLQHISKPEALDKMVEVADKLGERTMGKAVGVFFIALFSIVFIVGIITALWGVLRRGFVTGVYDYGGHSTGSIFAWIVAFFIAWAYRIDKLDSSLAVTILFSGFVFSIFIILFSSFTMGQFL